MKLLQICLKMRCGTVWDGYGLGWFRGGRVILISNGPIPNDTRTVRQIPGGPGTKSLALARAEENKDFNHCSLL